jgi:hypothetical protein
MFTISAVVIPMSSLLHSGRRLPLVEPNPPVGVPQPISTPNLGAA